jgi:multicomponent Na+:H+ antiporter subunit F
MRTTDVALALLVVGVLAAVVRVWVGPTTADRAIGAELVFISAVGGVVLVAARTEQPLLLDLALVAVLVGFVATISLARLVHRKDAEP